MSLSRADWFHPGRKEPPQIHSYITSQGSPLLPSPVALIQPTHPDSGQCRVSKGYCVGTGPGMLTTWARHLWCVWVVDLKSLCPTYKGCEYHLWSICSLCVPGSMLAYLPVRRGFPYLPLMHQLVSVASFQFWNGYVLLSLDWGTSGKMAMEYDHWQLKATSCQTKASKYQRTSFQNTQGLPHTLGNTKPIPMFSLHIWWSLIYKLITERDGR